MLLHVIYLIYKAKANWQQIIFCENLAVFSSCSLLREDIVLNVNAHLKKMHLSAFGKTSCYTLRIQTQRTVKSKMFHLLLL